MLNPQANVRYAPPYKAHAFAPRTSATRVVEGLHVFHYPSTSQLPNGQLVARPCQFAAVRRVARCAERNLRATGGRRLWTAVRTLVRLTDVHSWAWLLAGFSVVAAAKGMGLAVPFAMKRAINALATGNDNALRCIATFGVLKGTSQALNNSKNVVLSRISRPLGRRLSIRVYQQFLSMELQFHTMRKTGELLRRLDRSSRAVDTLLRAVLFTLLPVCCELFVVFGLLTKQGGVKLAIIVLVAFVSYVVFTLFLSLGWVTEARRTMNRFDDAQSAKATEALLNVEQVKSFAACEREIAAFGEKQLGFQRAALSSDLAASCLSGGQQFITTTGLVSAILLVARQVQRGLASVGDVVMVQSLVQQLWNPLQFLGYYAREAKQAFVDLEDAQAILARLSLIPEPEHPLPLPRASSTAPLVRLQNVSYNYADGPMVLRNVSFEIPMGARVALVGPSGCGKTTIGRHLPRLYDPCAGGVYFNGVDLRQISVPVLCSRIAVVSQDVVVFNETIRYNLLYARPTASEQDLAEVLQATSLESTIAAMPEGLDTVVGERGLRLSGGERQRLALARALLRKPELLILDEATSALDADSERVVLSTLRRLDRSQAVLHITHRFAVAREADDIIYLEAGRIVERGSHQQLIERGGAYARMIELDAPASERSFATA